MVEENDPNHDSKHGKSDNSLGGMFPSTVTAVFPAEHTTICSTDYDVQKNIIGIALEHVSSVEYFKAPKLHDARHGHCCSY